MQPLGDNEDELDLRHYLDVVWRRKVVILLATLAATAVAVLLSARQTPQYRASSEVLLRQSDSEQRLGSDQFDQYDVTRVDTEIGVMRSNVVKDTVAEELGRQPAVSISRQEETDLVAISATSIDPAEAAETANVFATAYVDWKRQTTIDELLAAQQTVQTEIESLEAQLEVLLAPLDELDRQILSETDGTRKSSLQAQRDDLAESTEVERASLSNQIALYQQELSGLQVSQRITRTGGAQVVSLASVPGSPFAPQPFRNGVLGGIVGLMLGLGLAFLLETFDDRLRSKEDLERATGWPTLGLIPVNERAKDGEHDLVSLDAPTSISAEAYRTLRTAVQFLGLDQPLQMIQVTSPTSGDGKTTTASNLAITLARSGNRVILVDADLRRPRIHNEFNIPNDEGFTSILLGQASAQETFHEVGIDNLFVMPSGPPPPNPSELLALRRTRDLFRRLREECDVLIVDSPPLLPVTDPLVLAGYADGVLVVTDGDSARVREVRRAAELLDQVNANVLGVVVNRVQAGAGGYSYDYSYGYPYGEAPNSESNSRPPPIGSDPSPIDEHISTKS